jgi:predicted transcriptional regulator
MDLIRTILLEVEERGSGKKWMKVEAPEYSPEEISYHVKLLAEAGLIEGKNLGDKTDFLWVPISMTWRGHEFLDAARNEKVWQGFKARLKDHAASVPFAIAEKLLIALTAKHVGL